MRTLAPLTLLVFVSACSSSSPGGGTGGTGGSGSGTAGTLGTGGGGTGGSGSGTGGTRGGGGTGGGGGGGTRGGGGTGGGGGTHGGGGTGGGGGGGTHGSGGSGGGTAGTHGSGGIGGTSGGTGGATNHTNPLTQDVIDAFVSAHNAARSGPLNPTPNPALPPVTWDPILADSAYNYTALCQGSGGLLSHNANRSTDYQALGGSGYVGENIYATTANTVAPADAVSDWMSEASQFNYTADDIGDGGHYTQVVWRASIRIGCAIVNCPSLTYHDSLLCDYSPGGNITGQEPY